MEAGGEVEFGGRIGARGQDADHVERGEAIGTDLTHVHEFPVRRHRHVMRLFRGEGVVEGKVRRNRRLSTGQRGTSPGGQ